MTTESADHGSGLAFGFGLAQPPLFVHILRFCPFTSRHITTPLRPVLSRLLIFCLWDLGSVILSLPKTCARLCSYQCAGVDTTVRGRVGGVPLRSTHFIPLHSNKAEDFHVFIKNKPNHSSRFIEKVRASIYTDSKSRSSSSRTGMHQVSPCFDILSHKLS